MICKRAEVHLLPKSLEFHRIHHLSARCPGPEDLLIALTALSETLKGEKDMFLSWFALTEEALRVVDQTSELEVVTLMPLG